METEKIKQAIDLEEALSFVEWRTWQEINIPKLNKLEAWNAMKFWQSHSYVQSRFRGQVKEYLRISVGLTVIKVDAQ